MSSLVERHRKVACVIVALKHTFIREVAQTVSDPTLPDRCHGLDRREMPRACPVEIHAGRYTDSPNQETDATGLSRGGVTFSS